MNSEKARVVLVGYTVPNAVMDDLLRRDPYMPIQTHRFAWSLVEALREGGLDVDLVSTLPAANYPKNPAPCIPTRKFNVDGVPGVSVGYPNFILAKQLARLLGLGAALVASIAVRGKPLALVVHGTASAVLGPALLVGRLARVPVVTVITDVPNWRLSKKSGPIEWLHVVDNMLTLALTRRVDAAIAFTAELAQDFMPARPSLVMEGIAPLAAFAGQTRDASLSDLPADTVNVAYLGGLREEYGVLELIKAMPLVAERGVCLHLFGKGPLADSVEGNERVYFHGMKTQAEVAQIMTCADLLVNPRDPGQAFTRYSFPSKLLEYLASGTPTLSTRLPGIPIEYADHINWAESPTAEGLALAISDVLAQPERERLARAARAQEFVRREKGPAGQGRRLAAFLRGVARGRD